MGLTQIPHQPVYRTFVGYYSHGAKYSGLLEKCPALSTHDQTTSAAGQDSGSSIRRKETAFSFSREISSSWSKGGRVWLRPDDGDGDGIDRLAGPRRQLQHVAVTSPSIDGEIRTVDLQVDGGNTKGSTIKNNTDRISPSYREKRSPPMDQEGSTLLPSHFSSLDGDKNEINSYGVGSPKAEQNDARISPSLDGDVMKSAEVDGDVMKRSLTLARVDPGDYSRKPDKFQVFSYSLKHIKS